MVDQRPKIATSHLSQLFEEGRVKLFTDEERSQAIILRSQDFPYDYAGPQKSFFICNMTCQNQVLRYHHLAISMADPKNGKFVFMDVSGIPIMFEDIDGCHLFVYKENGEVSFQKTFRYYGLETVPRLCFTAEENNVKRCLVHYRTKPAKPDAEGQKLDIDLKEDEHVDEKSIFDAMFSKKG